MSAFTPVYDTLSDLYRSSVEQYADQPLFGVKDGSWQWITYREVGRQIDQMRGLLHGLGIEPGDRVGIISNNRPEWAVVAGAAYQLGATVVPMYESQLAKDWRYIIEDCGARVLFVANTDIADTVESFRDELPGLEHVVTFGDDLRSRLESVEPHSSVEISRDTIADIIYTSGTTGRPKGVVLSHANLADNLNAILELLPVGPGDVSLSFLPWAHSFGQTVELHGLMAVGAAMAIAESPDKIPDNLMEVRPTVLVAVPRIFNRVYDGVNAIMEEEGGFKKRLFDAALANEYRRMELAERGERRTTVELKHQLFDALVFSKIRERFGGRLRMAASGSAALSPEVNRFIDALGITVLQGYGLSETSPVATVNRIDDRKIGSVGPPIPGVRIELDHVATADPNDGEVIIYGHCVMQGYHNLPEENAKVFTPDGGLRTGDIGHLDEDGHLYITGRVKEQYKLETGKYVVPVPLEEQIRLSPFIANVMVYGMNRPFNVAVVVPDWPTLERWAAKQGVDTTDRAALLSAPRVRDRYAEEIDTYSQDIKPYEKIKDFVLIADDFTQENGILSQTLKVKRREVMKRYGDLIEALYQ